MSELFLFLSSSIFALVKNVGEELHDAVEQLFDLIEVLVKEIYECVAGQFCEKIFHDFVLQNSKYFFRTFHAGFIIHSYFRFVNTFFINNSLFFGNLVFVFV